MGRKNAKQRKGVTAVRGQIVSVRELLPLITLLVVTGLVCGWAYWRYGALMVAILPFNF
jgi:hypothetical protein